jgi:hypothetical protein
MAVAVRQMQSIICRKVCGETLSGKIESVEQFKKNYMKY